MPNGGLEQLAGLDFNKDDLSTPWAAYSEPELENFLREAMKAGEYQTAQEIRVALNAKKTEKKQ